MEIPYRDIEREERRFWDDRLEVVDYDAATQRYFRAVDLRNDEIAMSQGLEPQEQDPQFHQQMVYAVASKVLENFDRALGRRLRFRRGERLRLIPHAFQARNAYFDKRLNAVLFGYFPADEEDPGPNLPGQWIFTCLSHDIIAHEVAHAALSRLHVHYDEPTNPEVPALHEAFADIVALFQRLTFPEVVAPAIRDCRGDLLDPASRLLDVGAQFGAAAGRGGPLRRIAGKPDPALLLRTKEPHALGWVLVSAAYEGFVSTYVKKTRDLLRIATGGSGTLPAGELHPDLVNRLTTECVKVAQAVLSMCIRATDYLPPVDPTFSDFLRAMVTADFELNRADDSGLRAAMIEAFRQRGIRPKAVGSLTAESLLLESEDDTEASPDPKLAGLVHQLLAFGVQELDRGVRGARSAQMARSRRRLPQSRAQPVDKSDSDEVSESGDGYEDEGEEPEKVLRTVAVSLHAWAVRNRNRLKLDPDPDLQIALRGFHPVHRTAANGELLVEMVAQFVQTKKQSSDLGGLCYRAGTTMVANFSGQVRYLIVKPFHAEREQALTDWVRAFDTENVDSWATSKPSPKRIVEAHSAKAMDQRRWR
ncbi:hypothetical protein [Dokdonella ginsengisoli]|uniref:Uncharacterized protein n=1 Tax=Dokdonella ginsengisoli TaxID=363846 RepID=A0ABV9QWK6_9GAMM